MLYFLYIWSVLASAVPHLSGIQTWWQQLTLAWFCSLKSNLTLPRYLRISSRREPLTKEPSVNTVQFTQAIKQWMQRQLSLPLLWMGLVKQKHFVLINILLPTSEKPAKCSSVGVSYEPRGLKLTVNSDIIMRWRGPPTFPKPFTLARTHASPSPILDPHIQTLKGHYLQYKLQYNTSLKNMRSLKTYRSSWQKNPKNQLFSKLGSYGIMWKIIIIKKQKQSDSLTAPLWGVRSVWPQLYLASMLKVRWRMGLVDHAHIFSSFVWKQAAIQRITLDPISQYVQFCFAFLLLFSPLAFWNNDNDNKK